jgi:hypothetical protein
MTERPLVHVSAFSPTSLPLDLDELNEREVGRSLVIRLYLHVAPLLGPYISSLASIRHLWPVRPIPMYSQAFREANFVEIHKEFPGQQKQKLGVRENEAIQGREI